MIIPPPSLTTNIPKDDDQTPDVTNAPTYSFWASRHFNTATGSRLSLPVAHQMAVAESCKWYSLYHQILFLNTALSRVWSGVISSQSVCQSEDCESQQRYRITTATAWQWSALCAMWLTANIMVHCHVWNRVGNSVHFAMRVRDPWELTESQCIKSKWFIQTTNRL